MEENNLPAKSRWPKIIAAVCAAVIVIFIAASAISQQLNNYPELTIGKNKISVELALTEEQRAQGLSGRDSLDSGKGMLFVYDGYYIPKFWMKDMKFPIDIIWIKDDVVAGAARNLPPEGSDPQQTYEPLTFVNYALEVPAGYVDAHQIRIGDKVEIKR